MLVRVSTSLFTFECHDLRLRFITFQRPFPRPSGGASIGRPRTNTASEGYKGSHPYSREPPKATRARRNRGVGPRAVGRARVAMAIPPARLAIAKSAASAMDGGEGSDGGGEGGDGKLAIFLSTRPANGATAVS